MARSIVQGFLSILGGKFGIVVLSMVITPLLTRILGSGDYGDYAFLSSMIVILMIITNAGIFDGIRKYIAESRDIVSWESGVFAFYTRIAGVLAIAVCGLLVLSVELGVIRRLLGQRFEGYFYLLCAIIVVDQFSRVFRSGLMGFGLEQYSESLKVADRILFGVTAVSLSLRGWGVTGVLVGQIVATGTIAVAGLWILRPHISYRQVFSRASPEIPRGDLLSFNMNSTLLIVLLNSLYHTDVLLLQPLAGSQQTGYYKIALVAAEFLWLAPFSLQLVLLHSTSEMWAKGQYDRISQIASRATRYGLALTLLLAIGLGSLADPFLPLYFGPEYDAAITPLLILLPGALGFALSRPLIGIGQGKGDLRVLIIATGVGALTNICLNLFLIPQYGMNGAALATSVGYGSMLVLHSWGARKVGFDPFVDLRLKSILITAGISAPIIVGLSRVIPSDIVALIVVPPIGFVLYFSLALKTGVVDYERIRMLSERLPGKTNWLLQWLQ